MNSVKTCFLVGLIVVSVVVAGGVVGSAVGHQGRVVKFNTGVEEYVRIQDAVDAASPGDIIVVYNPEKLSGYWEGVDITEQLTLEAEDLSNKPIIYGGGSEVISEDHGIVVRGTEPSGNPEINAPDNVVINGFHVRHDTSDSKGIWLIGTENSTVKNNVICDGWDEGIYLNEADNNTIGPGNEVKYNGIGLMLVSSDDTSIKDSKFNKNDLFGALLSFVYINGGGEFRSLNTEETSPASIDGLEVTGSEFNENSRAGMAFGLYYQGTESQLKEAQLDDFEPGYEVKNISIKDSEFNENGIAFEESYGLLSSTSIDGMTVTGSEFNNNNGTGMAFSQPEAPADEPPPPVSVNNLTIEGSHFNDNVYFDYHYHDHRYDDYIMEPVIGFGLRSSVDTSNMEVTTSTFNNNLLAGMYFGPPPEKTEPAPQNFSTSASREEVISPINTVTNLTIRNSDFNENGIISEPPGGFRTMDFLENGDRREAGMAYGFLSGVNIEGMEVYGSDFNRNTAAGMAFAPQGESNGTPQSIEVKNISISDSHFDNNGLVSPTAEQGIDQGIGLITYFDTSNLEVKSSTFNGNSTAGMSLGPTPMEEYYIPTASNISITGSSFKDNGYSGLFTNANIDGMDITRTEVKGNYFGIFFFQEATDSIGSSDISIHYSSINQSSENPPEEPPLSIPFIPNAGIVSTTDNTVNATINWWGAPDGPSADWKWKIGGEFDPEYEGEGDKILGSVAFAPWLGEDPDSNPDKPGIQLIDPLPIIVRRRGPKPTTKNGNTGYLDMGIWGASSVPVKGRVIVPHGNWKAKEPLGNNAELISGDGTTCHTCLEEVENSELTIDGNVVTVGKLDGYTPRGFIIKDEVKVQPGVDASTVHLNWNDIRDNVENDGDGRLGAEYNWWGDLDPSDSVTGYVDYRPFLPEDPCSFTDYMKEHNLENPREAVVNRMSEGETCSTDLPKRMIVNYHLKPREAEELVDEYGCYDIRKAMEEAEEDFGTFKDQLGVSKI